MKLWLSDDERWPTMVWSQSTDPDRCVEVPDELFYDLKNAHRAVTLAERAIVRHLKATDQKAMDLYGDYDQGPDDLN